MSKSTFDTLCCLSNLAPTKIAEFRTHFKTVHFHPDKKVPEKVLADIDVWLTSGDGIPESITSDIEKIPKTKIVQLSSGMFIKWWRMLVEMLIYGLGIAGANSALKGKLMQSDKAKKQIFICNASGLSLSPIKDRPDADADIGIHAFSIPQYIIAQIVNRELQSIFSHFSINR